MHRAVDARPGDADLARVVDQTVEQTGPNTHCRTSSGGALSRQFGGRVGRNLEATPVDAWLHWGQSGLFWHRCDIRGRCIALRQVEVQGLELRQDGLKHGDWGRLGLLRNHRRRHRRRCDGCGFAQRLEGRRHGVGARHQGVQLVGLQSVLGAESFDGGLEHVRHFAQAHGAGQTGTPLEGVQGAHAGGRGCGVARMVVPIAKAGLQLRQELVGLFLEYREELGVDRVDRIKLIFELVTR